MATIFLAILFIAGLLFTLFNFQTKKFMAWLQSLFTKTTSKQVPTNPTTARKAAVKSSAAKNKAELKSVFATFDKNNDGFITKQELGGSLKNIGIHTTEKEVADMVEKVDFNGDGLIDLDEFCELFEAVVGGDEAAAGGDKEEEVGGREEGGEGGNLKDAFDVFDGDGDGLITVEELGLVLSSLGLKEGKRLENCKEMIRKVDMDGDGMVSFDEFKAMMKAGGRLIAVS